MKAQVLTLLALALTLSPALHAADKMPLEITCTNETQDFVGTRLCSALRDDLAGSPRYQTSSADTRWVLRLLTMSTSSEISSQSVVLTLKTATDDYFAGHWLFVTGSSKADEQARTIFSSMDKVVGEFMDATKNIK